ncbi:hypothetical protein M405DRAFT_863664 [Rhizopogon salebrosus TDB-379]|nr:hypothetical protein M405DRAFT_863664 [Rhizopogon salebrosus TDB-379]
MRKTGRRRLKKYKEILRQNQSFWDFPKVWQGFCPSPSPPQLSRKQKGKGRAKVFDEDDNDEQEVNEDRTDEGPAKKGRLLLEVVLKAQELGQTTVEAAKVLVKVYGKSARVILIEAGLAMRVTRKESPWNQHQTWFKTIHPISREQDISAWKEEQAARYKAHPYKDPKHAVLWQSIQDSLMMRVHDDFSKLAGYWFRTHGIHIGGVAIFPGYEDAGCQASGFFSRYKDLEAVQAEGVTFSFLPPSTTIPNSTLLCNGKSTRDRNRKVAPMIISKKFAEAGHPLKTSNNRFFGPFGESSSNFSLSDSLSLTLSYSSRSLFLGLPPAPVPVPVPAPSPAPSPSAPAPAPAPAPPQFSHFWLSEAPSPPPIFAFLAICPLPSSYSSLDFRFFASFIVSSVHLL